MARPTPRDLAYKIARLRACREAERAALIDLADVEAKRVRAQKEHIAAQYLTKEACEQLNAAMDEMTKPGLPEERFPDGPEAQKRTRAGS